jgi:hypothetical protein
MLEQVCSQGAVFPDTLKQSQPKSKVRTSSSFARPLPAMDNTYFLQLFSINEKIAVSVPALQLDQFHQVFTPGSSVMPPGYHQQNNTSFH